MIRIHRYLYLVGRHLRLCRAFSALINFPIFLALDFLLLLDVWRNRLKFHIDLEQDLKKLLNMFLDLSCYLVTIASTILFLQCKLIVLNRSLEDEVAPSSKTWVDYRNTNGFGLFHFHSYLKLSKMRRFCY